MECEQAERGRTVVRQGDVLAAHPGTTNWQNRWKRFYIVLSADCDIANKKLDTGLVVVPVVGLWTYAVDIWLPEQLRKQLLAADKKIESLLGRLPPTVIQASAFSSIERAQICDELERITANNQSLKKTTTSLVAVRDGYDVLRGVERDISALKPPLGRLVVKLCEAKSLISGSTADPEKELKNGLASIGDSKRNDLWPICDLVGLDPEMREDEHDGFVAVLRRFTQIALDDVLIDRTEWLNRADSYLRVSRLRGLYKTDFLSKFATLFTRVGLEDGRDEEHQRIFGLAATRILRAGEQ